MITSNHNNSQPFISEIRISTNLSPNPEFAKNPEKFVYSRNWDHIHCMPPETSFTTDYKSQKKLVKQKSNIGIGHDNPITFFLEDDGRPCITSIKIEPLEILQASYDKNHNSSDYLHEALSIMQSQVTPLLESSVDAQKMIPSSASNKDCSYFSKLEVKAFHKDIKVHYLHHLSHPLTGSAEGATKTRIQLVSRPKDFSILFKDEKWHELENGRLIPCEGIAVTLTLKKAELARQFPVSAIRRMGATNRVVNLTVDDASNIYGRLMSQLEGIYLPLPLEWMTMGKRITSAKAIALYSKATRIPVTEMINWDQEIRNPSKSTIDRLNKDTAAALAVMKEIPVAQLFSPSDKA
ncbi:MAG: hypothetical protein EAZ81_04060 [Verrucomicrobia bacterium]|nr:MAG: hypothetical protein EAZ81_04060 [Verrucomicrobiota bacterium]